MKKRTKTEQDSNSIERFHSRDQRPYLSTETKENVCIKIELNSRGIGLVHTNMVAVSLFWP